MLSQDLESSSGMEISRKESLLFTWIFLLKFCPISPLKRLASWSQNSEDDLLPGCNEEDLVFLLLSWCDLFSLVELLFLLLTRGVSWKSCLFMNEPELLLWPERFLLLDASSISSSSFCINSQSISSSSEHLSLFFKEISFCTLTL